MKFLYISAFLLIGYVQNVHAEKLLVISEPQELVNQKPIIENTEKSQSVEIVHNLDAADAPVEIPTKLIEPVKSENIIEIEEAKANVAKTVKVEEIIAPPTTQKANSENSDIVEIQKENTKLIEAVKSEEVVETPTIQKENIDNLDIVEVEENSTDVFEEVADEGFHETPAEIAKLGNAEDIMVVKERNSSGIKDVANATIIEQINEFLLNAMSYIGIKYTYGGESPETGFDCSGIIKYLFSEEFNKDVPRTTTYLKDFGKMVNLTELRSGDLVFFNTLRRPFSHVGIYIGDGKFLHSPRKGRTVSIENMNINYWQKRYNGARRIITNLALK